MVRAERQPRYVSSRYQADRCVGVCQVINILALNWSLPTRLILGGVVSQLDCQLKQSPFASASIHE